MQLSIQDMASLNLALPWIVILLGLPLLPRLRARLPMRLPEHLFGALTFLGSLACLWLSLLLMLASSEEPVTFAYTLPILGEVGFLVDALSIYFLFLVNVIATFAAWNMLASPPDLQRDFRFNVLVNLFHFTMLMVPLIDNLVVLWIAVEATTLVSTLLVSFLDEKNSWEAAWKYLMVTSTGIIFGLLGTMFLANAAESLVAESPNQIMNWSFLVQNAERLTPEFVVLSFLFVLVGYGTKAGFAPMHTWLPDGHSEAPASISALLSGVLLKSALYAILRFAILTDARLGSKTFTSSLLLVVGVISLVVSVPFILNEGNRFKRVLAYHSLEHMGIITLGLGIGGEIAVFGALLHAVNHAVTKCLMFLAYGNARKFYARLQREGGDARPLLQSMPVTGGALALGGLALVGMPPFNIFLSEMIIMWGAVNPQLNVWPFWVDAMIVVLFMIATTLIFYGLVRHLARLLLKPNPDELTGTGQALGAADAGPLEIVGNDVLLILLTLIIAVTGLFLWEPFAKVVKLSVDIIN